jgi:hypothetical protein
MGACVRESDGTKMTGEDASAVLDMAIYLGGVFHVAEWIRSTILLVIVLVGVNLMQIWYVTAINALYGIAIFIYIMVVVGSEDGKSCAASQPTRYRWLEVEIIYFWILFWIYQVPFMIAYLYKKEKLHEIMNAESEEEED